MGIPNIVERLGIQIEALQEGFELLYKAANARDLGGKFSHILRGNFVTSDISIYSKTKPGERWERLHGKDEDLSEYLPEAERTTFALRGFGGRKPKIAVVQMLADKSRVGVVMGRKLDGTGYSTLDRISLQIFLQLYATAYQAYLHRLKEKDLVFSLNHRLLQLNSLIDTGIELSGLKHEASLHKVALERAAMLTNASRGFVTISEGRARKERTAFPAGAKRLRTEHSIRSRFSYAGQTYTFELQDKESRTGTGPFEETDQLLLDALARQVHSALENNYLHQQEIEKQKIERDISVAAAIQKRILPDSLPSIPGYDVFGFNIPTRFVGGDYYDCIPLPDGTFAIVIADVAGKGVPAALLVSSFHASLSAYFESGLSLLELAQKLNIAMFKASPEERYVTAFIGLLNPATGEFRSVNAGHNPVYVVRNDGTIGELGKGGIAFGMIDMDIPYQNDSITIEHGERVLLYTDGVTEAMDPEGKQYDTGGTLTRFVTEHRPQNADAFIHELIDDVTRFTKSAPQSDDITALYLLRH